MHGTLLFRIINITISARLHAMSVLIMVVFFSRLQLNGLSSLEQPKIMFLLLSFILYFSKYMKNKVKIYDKIIKTIKKLLKNLLLLLFTNVRTFSTKTYYFTLQTFY